MKRVHIAALSLVVLCTAIWVWGAGEKGPQGELPLGADGKPLNLDFETGTLKDWTATGDAFNGQPIKGDKVAPRRGDMKSQHQGEYWIGGFEKLGDDPKGTLTSVPFKVTQPWASFLVAGGAWVRGSPEYAETQRPPYRHLCRQFRRTYSFCPWQP